MKKPIKEAFNRPSKPNMRFSDGMEFNTRGDYRIVRKSDGLYVVGHGSLTPVASVDEANELMKELTKSLKKESKFFGEGIEDHDNKIERTLANMLGVKEVEAQKLVSTMALGDYVKLALAADSGNIKLVRQIIAQSKDQITEDVKEVPKKDNTPNFLKDLDDELEGYERENLAVNDNNPPKKKKIQENAEPIIKIIPEKFANDYAAVYNGRKIGVVITGNSRWTFHPSDKRFKSIHGARDKATLADQIGLQLSSPAGRELEEDSTVQPQMSIDKSMVPSIKPGGKMDMNGNEATVLAVQPGDNSSGMMSVATKDVTGKTAINNVSINTGTPVAPSSGMTGTPIAQSSTGTMGQINRMSKLAGIK